MQQTTVKWYNSLSVQAIMLLTFITLFFILGTVYIMNTSGQKLVSTESSKIIEEIGKHAVSQLSTRSTEIASLTRTLAAATEQLPKSESDFKQVIPQLVDFQGDSDIAGGGVWPEPYAFQAETERRSFFWGRESDGSLKYYDDYNQAGAGYHHEEWYVAVRHAKPGTCSWSESYMDPYSHQSMVTCTVATFDQESKFSGTVTIDLKLEGLQELTDTLQKQTGGYVFLLDRNNKFITFPDPERVKNKTLDDKGVHTESFMLTSEFAQKSPLFSPLSTAVAAMNQDILTLASHHPAYNQKSAEEIEQDSYQIDHAKAALLSAVIVNPLGNQHAELYQTVNLEDDFLLKKPSTAFIFHIPDSYWKLVIVKPNTEINAVATHLSHLMISYMILMAIIILSITYFVFLKTVAHPLAILSYATQQLGTGDLTAYDTQRLSTRKDEIGEIGRATYDLTHYMKTVIADIVQVSHGLSEGNLQVSPKITYKGEFVQIEHAILNLIDATKQNASQNWIKTGHAQLNEILSGKHSMEHLTKNTISFLTTYINAQIGLFYLSKSDDFQVIATYGYTDINTFELDTGLLEEVAKEQKTICRSFKQKELQCIIQSGFSRAAPQQIVCVPIFYDKKIIGMIEIGFSKEKLTNLQQMFLEQTMLNIGIAVNTTAKFIH